MKQKQSATLDNAILKEAVINSFKKLSPQTQWRNPVMFIVYVGAFLVAFITMANFVNGDAERGYFNLQLDLWLWFTVLFANFAEAVAEGRGKAQAKVGEKVKVTLLITADRDYDFVQITDKRAACLEPVNQKSGYQWGIGCYVSPRDHATNFYFDRLSKGMHIVEMEYYVDRKGDYQSGTCTAECTYSPEFGGRTEAYELRVNN